MLTAGQVAHKLIGKAGRREGGGGADPQSGEGGLGPGDGLARRGGLVRCRGRVCWANAELCAQCVGCSCKAVQGSRGCGACWAGERLRRAVRGLVGREPRCDMRSWLWRASAGCRGGGLRASCAMRLRHLRPSDPELRYQQIFIRPNTSPSRRSHTPCGTSTVPHTGHSPDPPATAHRTSACAPYRIRRREYTYWDFESA